MAMASAETAQAAQAAQATANDGDRLEGFDEAMEEMGFRFIGATMQDPSPEEMERVMSGLDRSLLDDCSVSREPFSLRAILRLRRRSAELGLLKDGIEA
jgi:hypothetical protein